MALLLDVLLAIQAIKETLSVEHVLAYPNTTMMELIKHAHNATINAKLAVVEVHALPVVQLFSVRLAQRQTTASALAITSKATLFAMLACLPVSLALIMLPV